MKKKLYTIEEKMRDRIMELQANEEFIADFAKLKKEAQRIVRYERSGLKGVRGRPIFAPLSKKFYVKLKKIKYKYNLSEAYTETLITFALMYFRIEEFNLSDNNFAVARLIPEKPSRKKNRLEQHLYIEILPETTITDIQKNWHQTIEIRDKFYKIKIRKERRPSMIIRDKYIFDLKKRGKKAKEIATIINNDERFSKKLISYIDVPIIIKRLQERGARNITPQKI